MTLLEKEKITVKNMEGLTFHLLSNGKKQHFFE